MNLDTDVCYQALTARDSRFDGIFFVGVKSTGIYCRTVCTAKTPLKKNCTFYSSAAASEKAGYRPCLRCRPELAPGNAPVDSAGRLALLAFNCIEEAALTGKSQEHLAKSMGISARHLRRVVESGYGVSPSELAITQKLLFAKRLLVDTGLPVTEVAFASGFSSLRRFNALFRERYHLKPTELRKEQKTEIRQESLICEVSYRPPFDWNSLLLFLSKRLFVGVEQIHANRYWRTVRLGEHRGWLSVGLSGKKNMLDLEVSLSLAPVLGQIICRIKNLFDLRADPLIIEKHLGVLAEPFSGLRVAGAFDGFELAVRAILGQQISIGAASTLAQRLTRRFCEKLENPIHDLVFYGPDPECLAKANPDELVELGVSELRAKSIILLANEMAAGQLKLLPGVDVEDAVQRLEQIPGIGSWTSQYIAMRALSWPDAFPHTDLGIQKALSQASANKVLKLSESWCPWRAYAAMHLWKSLEK